MFPSVGPAKNLALQIVALLVCLASLSQSLIITSVLAGDKKFKTISFDHKWLKPLTFEKEMPNTEFRRHRTVRPPKFDIDVNIPIKLPLEDEYPQEEYKKPVESQIYFSSGDIHEPNYAGKQQKYADHYATASSDQSSRQVAATPSQQISLNMRNGLKGILPALAKSIEFKPQFITESHLSARSDIVQPAPWGRSQMEGSLRSASEQIEKRNYAPVQQHPADQYKREPEFIPGGFVNLQLSGPTGGPKMTYEDVDKELWAQQLSQTAGAMPYPILNYQQLQNFYGGLGTFTNGLAEHRYVETSPLAKLKTSINQLANKIYYG